MRTKTICWPCVAVMIGAGLGTIAGWAAIVSVAVFVLGWISPAKAEQTASAPTPGATCQNSTTRYTPTKGLLTLEAVRVLELAPLPSGAAGAWVMPVAGSMAWAQFHVTLDSLTECQP